MLPTTTAMKRQRKHRPSTALKAGARHSRSDMRVLQDLHDAAVTLGAVCAPREGKAVNYDEVASAIRDAWYRANRSDDELQPDSWVQTVFDDAVIVSEDGELYRVPYQREGDEVVFAPREEWVTVRQVYLTEDGEEVKASPLQPESLTHPGAMICIVPPEEVQQALRAAAGVDAGCDHITLVYLGSDAEDLEGAKRRLIELLAADCGWCSPFEVWLNGFGRLAPGEDGAALVALVDGVQLPRLRATALAVASICDCAEEQRYGFIPHCTIGYLDPSDPTPDLRDLPPLRWVCDRITLVWAGERIDIPLSLTASPVLEVPELDGEENEAAAPVTVEVEIAKRLPGDTTTPTFDPAAVVFVPPSWDAQCAKSLGDGRIGAFTAIYGSPDQPDLSPQRDYFHAETDFWLDRYGLLEGKGHIPMLYHHGMIDPRDARHIAQAKRLSAGQQRDLERFLTDLRDDPVVGYWHKAIPTPIGIWLEGELDKGRRYRAEIISRLVDEEGLALSSDSTGHLVKRVRMPNGTHRVDRWPLVASSLTPTPAEPRLLPAQALKSAYALAAPTLTLTSATRRAGAVDSPTPPTIGAATAQSDRGRALTIELDLLTLE